MTAEKEFIVRTVQNRGEIPSAYEALKALPEFKDVRIAHMDSKNLNLLLIRASEEVARRVEEGLGSAYAVFATAAETAPVPDARMRVQGPARSI